MPTQRNGLAPKSALLIAAFLYAVAIVIFETGPLDLAIQDYFYNSITQQWIVSKDAVLLHAIFYVSPKVALYSFGALLFAIAIGRRKSAIWTPRDAVYILACMVVIPVSIAIIKKVTCVCCPWELARYGGEHEHRNLIAAIKAHEHCRCYPAGHASGGFGLIGLAFAGRKRTWVPALAAGWVMGLYQMLRGAHFLSHTVATMFVALIVGSALAMAFQIPVRSEAEN